ncbi:hypothetical protein [Thermogemmatispora sp.]|uniref:hypothetical protein n=1 Tax=Thermogemmatispora sp. TaxID=1968838 RepID=UPI0035E45695
MKETDAATGGPLHCLAGPAEANGDQSRAGGYVACFVPVKFDKLTTGRGINVAVRTLKDGYAHARMPSAGLA